MSNTKWHGCLLKFYNYLPYAFELSFHRKRKTVTPFPLFSGYDRQRPKNDVIRKIFHSNKEKMQHNIVASPHIDHVIRGFPLVLRFIVTPFSLLRVWRRAKAPNEDRITNGYFIQSFSFWVYGCDCLHCCMHF